MIEYRELGEGLHKALAAAGCAVAHDGRSGDVSLVKGEEAAAQKIIDNFSPVDYELTQCHSRIVSGFKQATANLVAQYPAAVRATWPLQIAEATAWQTDPTAATPFVDVLAQYRGISRESALNKILKKSAEYHALTAVWIGELQRLGDQAEEFAATARTVTTDAQLRIFLDKLRGLRFEPIEI